MPFNSTASLLQPLLVDPVEINQREIVQLLVPLPFTTRGTLIVFSPSRHTQTQRHSVTCNYPSKPPTKPLNPTPSTPYTMARNSEKAQSMLFRFRAAQAAESGILSTALQRRPKAPSTIASIPVCEKWRGQVLKEVSRKVTRIQDEALSDFQIRDLNDEINKLMKEKWGWERRIRELGGPNYMRGGGGGSVLDAEGREVPGGGKGYRYFGRAKELPGVKEMFERAAKRHVRGGDGEDDEKRLAGQDMARKNVDAAYFGYGEEGGSVLKYERKKEREAEERLAAQGDSEGEDKDWEPLPGDAGDGITWRLPTLDDVQEELVERRRRKLLDKIG